MRGLTPPNICKLEQDMSRFLLALIRNCGVAIAISIFFAAARGPSHPPQPGAVDALAAASASYTGSGVAAGQAGCDRPPGRVCRLVDAGQPASVPAP
ncbi:MAG: hypothetical protein ACRC1G_02845 [Bradyrhizobium sp.]|nr:hypothetical protein [Bradyrhizobium sp.]